MFSNKEFSSCGVGFIASLRNEPSHETLGLGLQALSNLEHRGGRSADLVGGDGAGILTDIPHELLGVAEGDAVASLFLPRDPTERIRSLRIFEETFHLSGLDVVKYREVPVNTGLLSEAQQRSRPDFLMAFIRRPPQCTTRHTFEKMLYTAKQLTRSRLREAGVIKKFFFTSLSAGTIVYKGLTTSDMLPELFLDLKNPLFRTRFALFHRRFSTNTASAWDTAQPFRMVAHNGEINTVSGNRAWNYARERALGLREDELLTHRGISDSGSVNEIVEALMFRSSIPHPEDVLAIMMPRANDDHPFYRFWSRAMEPWDGPALFTFGDARTIGARLDRSGFRPCRWARTKDLFLLSSEAGALPIPEDAILAKGSLSGGASVSVELKSGEVHFKDASETRENRHATFDARVVPLDRLPTPEGYECRLDRVGIFGYSDEDVKRVLQPMIRDGKEGIGSMGDTARLAALSDEPRSLFDFFFQNFAQVTNPPLDFLRERIVTDMSVVLGRKPNIFEPKEMIPLKLGVRLEGPVLTLGQMEFLKSLDRVGGFEGPWLGSMTFDMTFPRKDGIAGLLARIRQIQSAAAAAVKDRISIFILSDRNADYDNPPIPGVLGLSALNQSLREKGMRLRASLVVDTAEARSTHHIAVLAGFGAAAVCPYLALELARAYPAEYFGEAPSGDTPDERELRLVHALEAGLLKVMSKMGISVRQSYHGAGLFSILGLGKDVHEAFFPEHASLIGGLSLEALVEQVLLRRPGKGLLRPHLYKEHPKGAEGERHSMTLRRSKLIHKLVAETGKPLSSPELYDEYLKAGDETGPITLRHLLRPKVGRAPLALGQVQPREHILRTFGSGAMSFGAISAESQRDIILAMREIGGRSNSGEGGENPYYFTEGITASTKQIASGRFGVTAEYLMNGSEMQIKIAQGAKPGEGGQLMAAKVNVDIARARHSEPNVDLISPPPMHDIYSIEDLKQLIHELRQLKPDARVSVKLVSGDNIGTIAVGVTKAGADIIHISGHDGGTGAASLSSMKHAGLPWELGLLDVHRALAMQGLRHAVTLRVDGGLATGRDIVLAAMLGAEEFDFGKLLLVAEGCIMARICEKNTCPTGIATHDPKFKRLYRGTKDKVVALLTYLADDVRRQLAALGAARLDDIVGRTDLIECDPKWSTLRKARSLDLSVFLAPPIPVPPKIANPFVEPISTLNLRILGDVQLRASRVGSGSSKRAARPEVFTYRVRPRERAVLATLNGALAAERSRKGLEPGHALGLPEAIKGLSFDFTGSAGQGFAVFNEPGVNVRLSGEANDSVAKSMSGGKVVCLPHPDATFVPAENTLIGNCALYGATGGTLYVHGIAGNRFAVRNSGATAVVEGVGMHACEYMTRGLVVILGQAGPNVGAGMSGGVLYLPESCADRLNTDYVTALPLGPEDDAVLKPLLQDYLFETGSASARVRLENWEIQRRGLVKCVPVAVAKRLAQAGTESRGATASPARV